MIQQVLGRFLVLVLISVSFFHFFLFFSFFPAEHRCAHRKRPFLYLILDNDGELAESTKAIGKLG